MKVFEWHSELAERLRLKLGWSHYAIYWVSFIKGVAVTCLVYWLLWCTTKLWPNDAATAYHDESPIVWVFLRSCATDTCDRNDWTVRCWYNSRSRQSQGTMFILWSEDFWVPHSVSWWLLWCAHWGCEYKDGRWRLALCCVWWGITFMLQCVCDHK